MFSQLLRYTGKNYEALPFVDLANALLNSLAEHWSLDKDKLTYINQCLIANEDFCKLALLTRCEQKSDKPFLDRLISIIKEDSHPHSLQQD